MLIPILAFFHNLTTMLFGIFISAFFLGVKQNYKNVCKLLLFSSFEGALYIITFLSFGTNTANRLYALIIHLPLILFLTFYYKYPILSSCISTCTAYLCCQLSNWIGLLMMSLTNMEWCYYITRILTTLFSYFVLCKYVCHTTEAIFSKKTRDLCIIGFPPFFYYIFDYTCTKLSDLLYSGHKTIVEFMGFAFCISYFTFLFIYFREYENKQESERYSELMEMRLSWVQKEIEQVENSKQKLSILRHDMRHHLNILLTQLQNDNTAQAVNYIHEISNAYDDTIITSYCNNEIVNSVLSIYQTRFLDKGISFRCNISIGKFLPCPDTAICMILSNALENSMHALEKMVIEDKWINLSMFIKKNHLLFQIENPTQQTPKFIDGIPVSAEKGHGIGVKSIVFYVEQLHGTCHFSVSGHTFMLKIII